MSKRPGLRWKSMALSGERRLTAGLVHHRWPAWSPDGKRIAFAVGDGLDASWVIVDRRGRVGRTLEGPADGGASFGPASTGAPLAFGRRVGDASEIWLTPGGGARPVRLLGGDGRLYREPAFSPDGRHLAFACGEDGLGRTHLYLLDISTGKRRRITADPTRSDGRPAFSPDGELLFFEGAAPEDVAVYALRLGSNQLDRVTVEGVVGRRPAPLSSELVVVERPLDEGGGKLQLVLVDRLEQRERVLESPEAPGRELREACAHFTKRGKVRLAYTALFDGGDGEPRRFDVCVARLKGLSLTSALDDEALRALDENSPEEADSAA